MMETLTIHSGLKGFQLLESLSEVTPTAIWGSIRFDRAPMYLFLEAMAQLAALHVRYMMDFDRHAFLLKVIHCELLESQYLEGQFYLQAELSSQSSNAFSYTGKAKCPEFEGLAAELLIGTQAYDDQFQKEHLKAHYQKRFNQLLLKAKSKNPLQ